MLFTALSNISLFQDINALIHTDLGMEAECTPTHAQGGTCTLINECAHSYIDSHTEWHQSIENRHCSCQTIACVFSPSLQLSLYCTCLKFQALTLSVPSRLIFNAVLTGGCLFQRWSWAHSHTHTPIRIHFQTDAHTWACEHARPIRETHTHTHRHNNRGLCEVNLLKGVCQGVMGDHCDVWVIILLIRLVSQSDCNQTRDCGSPWL